MQRRRLLRDRVWRDVGGKKGCVRFFIGLPIIERRRRLLSHHMAIVAVKGYWQVSYITKRKILMRKRCRMFSVAHGNNRTPGMQKTACPAQLPPFGMRLRVWEWNVMHEKIASGLVG